VVRWLVDGVKQRAEARASTSVAEMVDGGGAR
jgi:hypothetical protein